MYADTVTGSMERALTETERRRTLQIAYNKEHGITPKTIIKDVRDVLEISTKEKTEKKLSKKLTKQQRAEMIEELTREMKEAARLLEFEHAAYLRDKIKELQGGT